MSNLIANLKIRDRLIVGFAAICLVLAGAVGATIWKVEGNNTLTQRMVQLRVPTAMTGGDMVASLYGSLAALRGWMLTGNPAFKDERAAVWVGIDSDRERIDALAESWTDEANKAAWAEAKAILEEFRAAQDRIEAVANSVDEQPATRILMQDAAPLGGAIIEQITAMIDEEARQPASEPRKNLLLAMADVRGSMGMALASIRAYLLSGDAQFKDAFDKFWGVNEKRFADLSKLQSLFTPTQTTAYKKLAEARTGFAPLPGRMFEIRGSDGWNVAQKLLVTDAAPRAAKLLDIFVGEKGAEGARAGGMMDRQAALLND